VRRGPGFRGFGGPVRRNRSSRRFRLRGLGQAAGITADAAFQQALSMYSGQQVNPRDSGNSAWISANERQIAAGAFDPYPGCTGQAPNLNLFQTATGVALGTVSAGVGILGPHGAGIIAASAVPVIGWVIAGVAAIISIIGIIFAHHAAAVKRDLNFSCSTLPAVNNAFALIMQAVQNGTMNPSDAANALPSIYSQFMAAGGASGSASGPGNIPGGGTAINNHPWCNSNCELSICLLGMVLYWQSQFQAMAEQAAAGPLTSSVANSPAGPLVSSVQNAVQSVATSTGVSPFVLWLLGGFLVYELVS
jgi:hypothetical protein